MKDLAIALISGTFGTGIGVIGMALLASGRHTPEGEAGPGPNYANWGG